jgi:hypothetical protein
MDRTELNRDELDQARRNIVLAHIEAECRKDAQGTVDTFSHHPRYELVPTGEVIKGGDKVFAFWQEIMAAFPDFTFDTHEMHFAECSVIVETTFRGAHLGTSGNRFHPQGRRSLTVCATCLFSTERRYCANA